MAAAKNITNNTINLNLLPLCPECNMDLNDGNITTTNITDSDLSIQLPPMLER